MCTIPAEGQNHDDGELSLGMGKWRQKKVTWDTIWIQTPLTVAQLSRASMGERPVLTCLNACFLFIKLEPKTP